MALIEQQVERKDNAPMIKFAVSKLSKTEFTILQLLAESKFAASTSEIFFALVEQAAEEVLRDKEQKIKFQTSCALELKRIGAKSKNKNPDLERIVRETHYKILRKEFGYSHLPAYPTVLGILDSMAIIGWVEKRNAVYDERTANKKFVWSIKDDVRQLIKAEAKK